MTSDSLKSIMDAAIDRLLSTDKFRETNNDLEFYLFAKYMNQNSREEQVKYFQLAARSTLFQIEEFREFAKYILLQQKSEPFLPDESSSFIQDAIKYLWDERFQLVQNDINSERREIHSDELKGKFISKEAIKIFLAKIEERNPDRDLKKEAYDQMGLTRAQRENLNKNTSDEKRSMIKKPPFKRHPLYRTPSHPYFTRSKTVGFEKY